MQIKLKGIFLIPLLVCSLSISAQQNSVSPYSRLGVGDRQPLNYTRGLSLGGATLALYDPLYINNANPASYTALELTTFEAGLNATFYQQEQSTPDISIENFTGGMRYLSAGIPFFDWWATAVGLQPYSYKGYNIEYLQPEGPDGIPITYRFAGSGGLNQFYWGNGFKVAKGLSLGVNARYIFGSLEDRTAVIWENAAVNSSSIEELVRANGFKFDAGLQYQYEFEGGTVAALGLTFANQADISADVNRYSFVFNSSNQAIDSLSGPSEFEREITLPSELGVGLAVGQRSSEILKYSWMVSADYETYQGSEYVNINGSSPLTDGYRAELGGYLTPMLAFDNLNRSSGYLSMIEYRVGGFYEKTPLSLAGRAIEDYGITFGLGMPVLHRNLAPGESSVTMLNTGLIIGQRGSLQNGLIREKYLAIYFGISLNDKWFIERKYR